MDLFETLGNDLRPENSKEALWEKKELEERKELAIKKEAELMAIAEKEVKNIIDPESPHFRNYTLMYCLGYQDAKLKRNSNLLEHITKMKPLFVSMELSAAKLIFGSRALSAANIKA